MAIYPVILSGGSGTRLWPLSREKHPKQFLALPDADGESLLCATLRRLGPPDGFAPPTVLCNGDHRFLVVDALGRAGLKARAILLEPVARGTAPAITVAALSASRANPEAVIAVMPSDHVIQDTKAFRAAITVAAEVARKGFHVLFGIPPARPHTGFGYVKRGAPVTGSGASHVDSFIEKPDGVTAERLIAAGDTYWNSGIFVLDCRTFLNEVKEIWPAMLSACREALDGGIEDLDFLRLEPRAFSRNPSISVDHAIMERTANAAMLPLDAGWSDVGTWSALWDLGDRDDDGNVVEGAAVLSDVEGCYIHSGPLLAAALGVRDLVVVATDDVVLVAPKDRAEDIRDLTARVKATGRTEHARHRRHHRPWGHFDVLNAGPGFKVKRITVKPGGRLSYQVHRHRSEHWVVVAGTARVTRGTDVETVGPNHSVYIVAGEWHRLENPGADPLEIIEVQIGDYLEEDDIQRADDVYNRSSDDE